MSLTPAKPVLIFVTGTVVSSVKLVVTLVVLCLGMGETTSGVPVVTPLLQVRPVVRTAAVTSVPVTSLRVSVTRVVVAFAAQVEVLPFPLGPVVLSRGRVVPRVPRRKGIGLRVVPVGPPLPLTVRRLPLVLRRLRPYGKT